MPDRKSKPKRPADLNKLAASVVSAAIGGEPNPNESKNPHAVALGRLGGKKGGKARAARLTPEERSDIARKAARMRWAAKADNN